jgi:hypothetical protein
MAALVKPMRFCVAGCQNMDVDDCRQTDAAELSEGTFIRMKRV